MLGIVYLKGRKEDLLNQSNSQYNTDRFPSVTHVFIHACGGSRTKLCSLSLIDQPLDVFLMGIFPTFAYFC